MMMKLGGVSRFRRHNAGAIVQRGHSEEIPAKSQDELENFLQVARQLAESALLIHQYTERVSSYFRAGHLVL
jgi:hypothetical protein